MMQPFRYALIITHNRPRPLQECVDAISPQVDAVLIMDNASDPPAMVKMSEAPIVIRQEPLQPPNIAFLWNWGLDYIEQRMMGLGVPQWDVALLCDDVNVPPEWFDTVSNAMRSVGAAAGSTNSVRPTDIPVLKVNPDQDIYGRMNGAAFIVVGEKKHRADETMHWWWCDTDMDWQARLDGGTMIAPGPVAVNSRPNEFTNTKPELGHQAGLDAAAFVAKWGHRPW
jgi:hypothetical protein